ncbi:MAG TPA: PQQ-binding-like beta-propeller repeat protein, partial [archaeon]|nr:PQQ-binding-like beta-propeller repeat protein [archaeon]
GATGLVVGVNGLVFASSYDKHLYALDMDGNLKWKFAAGERIVGPMVCSGKDVIFSNNKRSFDKMPYAKNPVVYFGSYDNYLYALGVDGKELWRFNCSSCVPGGIGFHEGIVYAGTISGRLYAIDSSGKEKWNFLTGGMVVGGAEVSGENVYVASFDQKIYCLNKNGEKIWDFLTGGPISSRPLIIGNKLYIGSADSFLYCLNIDKRSVEWTFQVGMAPSSVFAKAVGGFINAFAEYDRKIFKVWVPETTRGKIQGAVLQNYSAPQGFEFGGEQVYKSNSSLSDYFGKKTPYKK